MVFRWVLWMFAIAACGVSDADTRDPDKLPGRGTKACRQWQDAICDYAADRCGLSPRAACDHQYRGATCSSDSLARNCTTVLDNAECGELTAGCMIEAVGNPAPAMQACEQFIDALCEHYVACDQTVSVDACRQDADIVAIDCARAITYSLEFEQCIDDISAWVCDENKPASCERVFVLRNPA